MYNKPYVSWVPREKQYDVVTSRSSDMALNIALVLQRLCTARTRGYRPLPNCKVRGLPMYGWKHSLNDSTSAVLEMFMENLFSLVPLTLVACFGMITQLQWVAYRPTSSCAETGGVRRSATLFYHPCTLKPRTEHISMALHRWQKSTAANTSKESRVGVTDFRVD